MGGGAALCEWKSGHVRRVLRRRYAILGGDRAPAASRRHRAGRDGVKLSRWVDLPGRSVRTVVQPELGFGARRGHAAAEVRSNDHAVRMAQRAAAYRIPAADGAGPEDAGAILRGLACAPVL